MNKTMVPLRKVAGLAIAMIVAIGLSLQAQAQEITADHKKAASEAMKATGASNRLDQILPQLAAFTKAGLIANRPDIESEISSIVDDVAISLAERRGALEQEIVSVYTKTFTQAELEQISEFFGSETGIKFLNQTPLVFQEVDEISAVWRNGINRDMNKLVAEQLKEKGLQ